MGSVKWLLALSVVVAGCTKPAQPAHDHVSLSGEVDASLPPDAQAKQQALQRLLESIQRGTAFEYLPEHVPQVAFSESRGEFFGDAIELYRWSFAGAPQGNEVPVKLVFRLDQPGFPQREETRAYAVTSSGGGFIVARAK
jgi:hypothetical protein